MTPKDKARKLLNELPLSKRQRELYLRGVDRLTNSEAKEAIEQIEESLAKAPETLAAARRLLEERRKINKRS